MEAKANGGNDSAIQKIIGVFTSPAKTFASIDAKPTWLVPIMIVAAVSLLFTFVASDVLVNETLTQQEEKMLERGMDGDQIDQTLATTGKVMKYTMPIFAVIMPMIITAIVAGVFLFVGNVVLGGSSSFKKVFSVTVHSWLVFMVGALIMLPIVLAKETMQVSFSLATLMSDESKTSFLYQLLSKVDVFAIWWIAVFSIGMAVIYKMKTQKMAIAVGAVYAIYTVVASALTSMFS